jgi:hypothetical protein
VVSLNLQNPRSSNHGPPSKNSAAHPAVTARKAAASVTVATAPVVVGATAVIAADAVRVDRANSVMIRHAVKAVKIVRDKYATRVVVMNPVVKTSAVLSSAVQTTVINSANPANRGADLKASRAPMPRPWSHRSHRLPWPSKNSS